MVCVNILIAITLIVHRSPNLSREASYAQTLASDIHCAMIAHAQVGIILFFAKTASGQGIDSKGVSFFASSTHNYALQCGIRCQLTTLIS